MFSQAGIEVSKLFGRLMQHKDPFNRLRFNAVLFGSMVFSLCLGMLFTYQYTNFRTAIKIRQAFTDQYQDVVLAKLADFETKAKGLQAILQVINEKQGYAKDFDIHVQSSMVWSHLPKLFRNKNKIFSNIDDSDDFFSAQAHSEAPAYSELSSSSPNNPTLLIKEQTQTGSRLDIPQLELVLPLFKTSTEVIENGGEKSELLGTIHLELNEKELLETLQLLQNATKFSASLVFTDAANKQYRLQSDKFPNNYSTFFSPEFPNLIRNIPVFNGNLALQLKPTDDVLRIAGFGETEILAKIIACVLIGFLSWLMLSHSFHKAFVRQRLQMLSELEKAHQELQEKTQQLDASKNNSEDFIGILGHEIRNPLSTLKHIQAELNCIDLPDDVKRLLAIQDTALCTALDTLNNTLDLKKMELSALQLELVDFEPLLIIEEIRGLIAVQCRNKKIALQINLSRSIPSRIKGDPLRLKQVLLNLLNNAVKFTRTGGVIELAIQLFDVSENQVELGFQVIDSGNGIEASMIDKLLEPYKQADSSIARQYGGTGLGLNIASRIIRLMGGELAIHSKIGVGSNFTFRLKFELCQLTNDLEIEQVDHDKERRMSALQEQFDSATEKLKLLYVDDNDFNLMIAGELTNKSPHQLFPFSNPVEALEFLKESSGTVDIILSDVYMPDMNGLEFARNVRNTRTGAQVFIGAMTATSEEDLLLLDTEDFDCVLSKPFHLGKIIKRFEEFRSKKQLTLI